MEKTIKAMVDGGRATAGPPLGPALGLMGINAGQIIAKINEMTKDFAGMKIPVNVIVDIDTKEFRVEVGSPATSEIIKKEKKIEKGRKTKDEPAPGDIALEKVIEIAKKKSGTSFGKKLKDTVGEVIGSCVSLGVTINGKSSKVIAKEVKKGDHNSLMGAE